MLKTRKSEKNNFNSYISCGKYFDTCKIFKLNNIKYSNGDHRNGKQFSLAEIQIESTNVSSCQISRIHLTDAGREVISHSWVLKKSTNDIRNKHQ